jgi:hypothetical protein
MIQKNITFSLYSPHQISQNYLLYINFLIHQIMIQNKMELYYLNEYIPDKTNYPFFHQVLNDNICEQSDYYRHHRSTFDYN